MYLQFGHLTIDSGLALEHDGKLLVSPYRNHEFTVAGRVDAFKAKKFKIICYPKTERNH